MPIALICHHKDPQPWIKAITEHLPSEHLYINPTSHCPDVRFAICWKPPIGTWALLPNVSAIQSLGAGVDHLFAAGQVPADCQISRVVDPNLASDMFEYVLSHILMDMQNHQQYQRQQLDRSWQPHPYRRIRSIQVMVLGLGKIGAHVAQSLAEIGFEIKGWSTTKKHLQGVSSLVGNKALQESLRDVDVLINLLPLTPMTLHLINRESLRSLQDALFINVGRARHLPENEVLYLLKTGRIRKAVLDVFEEEPLPNDHPYWMHSAITVTPHVASITDVNTAIDQVVSNFKLFQKGQSMMNLVSHQRQY